MLGVFVAPVHECGWASAVPWALLPAAGGNTACEEHTYGCCFSEDVSNVRFVLLFSALLGVRKKPTGKKPTRGQ